MKSALTKKQSEAYNAIVELKHEKTYCPSSREIAEHLGVSQTAALNRVRALARKGWIKSEQGIARSISLL